MAIFKKGDKVVCNVDYSDQLTKGKVYIVTGACGNRIDIKKDDKGHANGWTANKFDHYKHPMTGNDNGGENKLKDTNPKDAVGIKKAPFSTVSAAVIAEIGIAMLEGARKYGRHNYRISSVRYSVYYDAAFRHLTSWWEGQDIDPDSGLSHITKALATLTVLRDAMIANKVVDDRPPALPEGWEKNLQAHVDTIFAKYPEAKEAFTQVLHGEKK